MPIPDEVRTNQDGRHPWTAEPGWAQLFMRFADADKLREKVKEAQAKFWKVWVVDERQQAAVMYKPAGITQDWQDDPERFRGTPRGHGSGFEIGDEVDTLFSGRITRHRIKALRTGQITQTGLTMQVDPPVPGSGYLKDDPGAAPREYHGWIDSAWFRRIEA